MTMTPHITYRRDLWLLFIAIGIFFCIGLGVRPYLTPSEARYIELPRQMLATHDWLTPRINGVPYFEKPPLFYWMQAIILQNFGMGEFAGRFVTVLFTTLTCLITYALGRMVYGRLSGLLAAGVLATSLMGYGLSRVATLDVPVSFFITATLGCFLAAQYTNDRRYYWLMYITAALAVMTKGLIGIVVPGLVIGAWIAMQGKWRLLKEVHLFTGSLLFLIIAAPWHVLMARAHPDFLEFYFIHEHFTRYLTDEHKRTAPWWFFIAVICVGLLPWLGLLPGALRRLHWKQPNQLFLLLWIALPLLFFSTSHSKLIPYIFPIFPPICIIIGEKLAQLWSNLLPVKSLRMDAALVLVLFGAMLLATQLLPALPGKIGTQITTIVSMLSPLSLLPMTMALLWLLYTVVRPCPAPKLILSLMGFGIVTGLSANFIAAELDTATIKPLAIPLAKQLQPDDMVVAYENYWQDLPVYLNRNIIVAGWTGELRFGYEHYPETHDWMLSTEEFWKLCTSAPHNVYVFTRTEMPANSNCHLHTIASYGKIILMKKE